MDNRESGAPIRSYMPQLDGLRAVAILLVAWSHWGPHEFHFRLPWGHSGVQLFFVLSGFLITDILLHAKAANPSRRGVLKSFYARRMLRIFPAYYVTLAVLWLLRVEETRAQIAWHALYLTNIRIFLSHSYDTILAHFWTLDVEEHFYLLWPCVVILLNRKCLARVAAGTILVAPLFRIVLRAWFPHLEGTVLMPSNADGLAAGALLAVVQWDKRQRLAYRQCQFRVCLPVFLVLQTAVIARGVEPPVESLRQTAMVVTFALLIGGAARGFRGVLGRALSLRPLVYLGKISYGLYLYHNFTPYAVREVLEWTGRGASALDGLPTAFRFAVLAGTTFVVASLSWMLLEEPLLGLKRHFRYAGARPS